VTRPTAARALTQGRGRSSAGRSPRTYCMP
jgi:hypothetical protein